LALPTTGPRDNVGVFINSIVHGQAGAMLKPICQGKTEAYGRHGSFNASEPCKTHSIRNEPQYLRPNSLGKREGHSMHHESEVFNRKECCAHSRLAANDLSIWCAMRCESPAMLPKRKPLGTGPASKIGRYIFRKTAILKKSCCGSAFVGS